MGEYYVAGLPCSNELYHYGILGQKWGVRRFQNKDGSLTTAGRARYSVGETKGARTKQAVKDAAKSAATYVKRRTKMKHPSLMTDDELREYTQRLIAEKNYSDALARAQSSTGFGRAEKFVSDIVTAVPKAAAKGVAGIPQDVVDIAKRSVNTLADAGFQRIANQIRKTNSERKLEKLQREQKIQSIQEEMDDLENTQAQRKELRTLQRELDLRNARDKLDDSNDAIQKQIDTLSKQKTLKDLQKALDPNKNGNAIAAAMQTISDPNATASQIRDAQSLLAAYNKGREQVTKILKANKGQPIPPIDRSEYVSPNVGEYDVSRPSSPRSFRPIQNVNPESMPQSSPIPATPPIQNVNPMIPAWGTMKRLLSWRRPTRTSL